MKRTILPAIAGFGLAGIVAGALAVALFVTADLGRSRAQTEGIAAASAGSQRAETVAALNRRLVLLEGGSPDPVRDDETR